MRFLSALRFYLTCTALLISSTLFAQCPMFDITLTEQSTVDQFVNEYSNCPVLSINLDIEISSQPVDYSGLSFIREINGNLNVGNRLRPGSSGFQNIEIVRGNLSTTVPNHDFNAIQLFTGLREVTGTLLISGGSDNVITGPTDLVSVNRLLIQFTTAGEINGFNKLTTVHEFIRFQSNNNLKTIGGFEALEQVNSIVFVTNSSLENVNGFNFLNTIDRDLNIQANTVLEDLSGFASLNTVGNVTFSSNENLTSVKVGDLTTVDRFTIFDNASLEDLKAFPSLTELTTELRIEENENFVSLNGLENVNVNTLRLRILNNPKLTECEVLCPYIIDEDLVLTGFFGSNGAGCSFVDLREDCIANIQGQVLDVDVNLITGVDRKRALDGAKTELIVEGEVMNEMITDSEGGFDINLDNLAEGDQFQIRTTHPEWPGLEVIHDYTLGTSDLNVQIEVPFSILDSVEVYLEKVDSVTIKASFAGGTFMPSYDFAAYDISDIQIYIFSNALSISENHEEVIESLKHLTLGLKMLDDYLQGCMAINTALSKSIYEGGKAMWELTGIMNSTEGLKEKFLDFLKNQIAAGRISKTSVQAVAYQKVLLNIINRSYDYMKSSVIDPYLASFGKTPEEQRFVQNIKLLQFTIEKTLLNAELLQGGLKELLIEGIVNGGLVVLTKNVYIDSETFDHTDQIFANALAPRGTFEQAVSLANTQKQVTFLLDNEAYQLVDNFSANSKNLSDFSSFLESLSIALAATGVGATVAGVLFQGSKVYKTIGLPQLGATLPVLGQRHLEYPHELDRTLLKNSSSSSPEQYPDEFLSDQIFQLRDYFDQMTTAIDEYKIAYSNPNTELVARQYLALQDQINNINALVDNRYYLNAISEIGFREDTIATDYQSTVESMGSISSRFLTIDMMTLAYFMDTTNMEIQREIQLELDTLTSLQSTLEDELSAVYLDAQDKEFNELLAVNTVSFPDSLNEDSFTATVSIQNYGPPNADSFFIQLLPSESLEIMAINGQSSTEKLFIQSLGLAQSETIEIDFKVLDPGKNMNLFVQFEDVRSIDATIPFEFISNALITSTDDINASQHAYTIFPNPGSDILNINGPLFDYVEILDQNGQLIASYETSQIDMNDLIPGIYYVRVVNNERVEVKQWIKY